LGEFYGEKTMALSKELRNNYKGLMQIKEEEEENEKIKIFLQIYEKSFHNIFEELVKKIKFLQQKHQNLFSFFHFVTFFNPKKSESVNADKELMRKYINEPSQT
jgi:hypothetical protein